MEIEQIKKALGNESWNGESINGTPYTQWIATEPFFCLWKISKEEIKSKSFSLYKHELMGWVVTFFGSHEGRYVSYDDYVKKRDAADFQKCYSRVMGWVEGGRGLDDATQTELFEEIELCKNTSDLYDLVQREADNPEAVWTEISQ